VEVHFCDPKSRWQRGSNENTDGLLRQYGTSMLSPVPFQPIDLTKGQRHLQVLSAQGRILLEYMQFDPSCMRIYRQLAIIREAVNVPPQEQTTMLVMDTQLRVAIQVTRLQYLERPAST
jgi:hypothetical protein